MKYGVLYGLSGGYLPTSHAGPFDTREEAVSYIYDSMCDAVDNDYECPDHIDDDCECLPEMPTRDEVAGAGLALDPTNEACYWSMVRLTDDEAKEWGESDGY